MKKVLVLMLCLLVCMMSCIGAFADINMPASLTVIGEEAFAGDDSITGLVKVSGNVRRIQSGAFADTGMTALIIPRSVQYVEDNIVNGSPVTYVFVRNGDIELSEHALDGARVIISEPGDRACRWAEAHGVEWYPAGAYELVQYGGFYYELRDDGTAKLLFAQDNEAIGSSVKLPVQVNYCTVTELSEYAFTRCYGLKSVSMPDTVTVLPDEVLEWPSIEFSEYSTSPDPVVPSEPEYVEMDMPNPNISLPIGFESYIATPEDAPEGLWMWYTSDESIVTVSQDGRMICKDYGTAAITLVIRAEDAIYCGVKYVNVVEPEITIEPINPEMFNMVVGQSTTPRYFFASNTHLSEQDFQANASVESGNTDIITVDENDVVTAVAPGITELIISTYYGDATAEVRVPVTVRENDLALSRTTLYTYVGTQEQLALMGELPEGATYKWSLDATDLASVDETGLVTVKGEGTFPVFCDITYADGSFQRLHCLFRSMEFVLEAAPAYDPYEVLVGESFTSNDLPVDGNINCWWFDAEEEIIESYVSSDNEVLLIEDNHFTALKPGKVTVTATIEISGRTTSTVLNFEVREPLIDVFIEPWLEGEPLVVSPWEHSGYGLEYGWDSELYISETLFSTSDPEVITVSADGVIYPHKNGTATISLTVFSPFGGSVSTSIDVIVEGASETLTPDNITMQPGEALTLSSNPELPEGVYIVDDYYFTDNDEVAIMRNSTVTAIGCGTTTIWHEINLSDDTTIFGKAVVTVVDRENPFVSLNAESLTLERYHTFQLEATFAEEPDSITWFSEDEEFVRVDENGLVMLLNCWDTSYHPQVGVIATIGDETHIASCPVTALPQRFVIQHIDDGIMIGENETYRINFSISCDEYTCSQPVFYVWESSDESIVTVNQDGEITGIATGVAYVSLTALDSDDNVMDYKESMVLVNRSSDEPTALALTQDHYLLTMEESFVDYYHVDTSIEATHGWNEEYLRFTSSNEKVFTVTDWGEIRPVAPGTATLTVSMAGYPDLVDTAKVTVVEDIFLSADKTAVGPGEEITVTLSGIPEGFDYDWIEWGFDNHAFQLMEDNGSSIRLACSHADGDDQIWVEISLYNEYYSEWFEIRPELVWNDIRLNHSAFILYPGDSIDIWTEFPIEINWDTIEWTSSDENVVTLEYESEPAVVTGVAPGKATVTFSALDMEGKEVTASAQVLVKEGAWTLHRIEVPSVILLNIGYNLDFWMDNESWADPEIVWTSSDPEVIEINQDEWYLVGKKPGSAVITVTAEKNGEVQTQSKLIRVAELPAYMNTEVVELRPNQTKHLSVIAGMGKEIESIVWRSTCESVISVDQEGKVTAVSNDGMCEISADVTFTDGTTAVAQCYAVIVTADNVWFELYHHDEQLELSVNDAYYPKTGTANFYIATNAMPEDISTEWFDYNEEIIRIGETKIFYEEPDSDHICVQVEIEALAEGNTWLSGRFYNDELGFDSNRGLNISAYNSWLEIKTDEPELTVNIGQERWINHWIDCGEGIGHQNLDVWTSSDESIVTVSPNGNVYGIAPGTATVTYKVYSDDDYLWDTQEFTVHVVGATLDKTELTLAVGETAQLTPSITAGTTIYGGHWEVYNSEIASVTDNGTVLATAPGTTKVAYVVNTDQGDSRAYCTVNVPYADEALRLNETSIELLPTNSFQLEYECTAGTPDSVEWSIVEDTDTVTVDENGLVVAPFDDRWLETYTVRCTTVCGDETYTAYCEVSIAIPAIRIHNFDGWMGIGTKQEEFIPVSIEVLGDIEYDVEFSSDDPDVAVLDTWEDGHVLVRGVGQGVTNVHYIVHTGNGETYKKSMQIFVDTEIPAVENFYFHESAILMHAPETGPKNYAHIPCVLEPNPCHCEITFTSSDEKVFRVIEDEWRVEAVGVGTAELIATVKGHPELNKTLPVVVTDEIRIVSDREDNGNAFGVAEQIQLSLESSVELPEGAYDVTFRTDWGDNHFSLSDDGLITTYEPGDYNLRVEIYMHGEEHENYELWYNFTVNRDENYFYTRNFDVTLHPDEYFSAHIDENLGLEYVTYSSSNEDVVVYDEESGCIKGVAPGTATITITGWYQDGNSVECQNTFKVTVVEPEAPVIRIEAPKIVMVGETLPVYIHSWNLDGTYNCPEHYYVSSDESILTSNGMLEGWGDFSITGMKPGMVYLTCRANYGDQYSEDTVVVYVVDAPLATINSGDLEVRPGYGKQLSVIPAEGMTIQSVKWTSSNEAVATVDENGWVMGHSADMGRALITAHVTFTDGSTYTASCYAYVTHDRDAWLHYRWHDDNVELALKGPAYPKNGELHAYIGTCLAPEELSVDFSIDNPETVAVTGWTASREDDTGDTIVVKLNLEALAAGDTVINLTVHNDALNVSDTRSLNVHVYDPWLEIYPDETEFTMCTGETRGIGYYTENSEGVGHLNRHQWSSNDESVVTVSADGTVHAIAPGTATVSLHLYAGDYLWATQDFIVHVVGVTLDRNEATLSVGDSFQLTPSVTDYAYIGNWFWESSNENVARVASDGTVLAVGPGSATIIYVLNDGECSAACKVTVPYTDEIFRLSETSIELEAGRSHQLGFEGEPNSVEWESNRPEWVSVDENGMVAVNPDLNHWGEYVTITAYATFGDVLHTATCEVTPVPANVRIDIDRDWTHIGIDHEEYLNFFHRALDGIVESVELVSDDPSVAIVNDRTGNDMSIRGVSSGVTTVRYIVHTNDGETYERSIVVYVGEGLPEIEQFDLTVDTLILTAPVFGGETSERHVNYNVSPDPCNHDIVFTSSDEGVVRIVEGNYVAAVAPGSATINVTVRNHPELNKTLPVVVVDSFAVTGVENNTMSVGQSAQLQVESSVNLPENSYDVSFWTEHEGHRVFVTEDGRVFAQEPGEYRVYANIDLMDGEWCEVPYDFTVTCDESYFYTRSFDVELHPEEKFGAHIEQNMDLEYFTYASSNEDVVVYLEEEGLIKAVAPGTATISITGVRKDGSTVECANTFDVTVLEPEAPDISIVAPSILFVDDTQRIHIDVHNHTTNGPDHHFVSSDETIMTVGDDGESFTITGVREGSANLTCYAVYGNMQTEVTIPVYVVNAPAWICTTSMEVRPGQTKSLVVVPDEGMTIQSIEWSSNAPEIATVDENGNVTGVSNETGNDAVITAVMTFDDGSTYTATTFVYVVHDENTWYDFYGRPDNTWLGLAGFGYPASTELWIHLNSNMAEDEFSVTWTSSDESVVKIDHSEFSYRNDPMDLNAYHGYAAISAVKDGHARVTITVEDAFGRKEEHTVDVWVETPSFEIRSDETELTISTGEFRGLNHWFESEGNCGHITPEQWSSSNPEVAQVSASGVVTGLNPGTATITYTVYSNGNTVIGTKEYTVHVIGASFDQPYYVLEQGTLHTLQLSVPETQEYDHIHWCSDNNEIASVSSSGVVAGVAPGTTAIRAELISEDGQFLAQATANVFIVATDERFTLKESELTLRRGQSAQMEYISEETPDSVEWNVEFDTVASIDENGLLTIHDAGHYALNLTVSCTATFGEEVRTAYCALTVPARTLEFDELNSFMQLGINNEQHIGETFRYSEGVNVAFEYFSENPDIAFIDCYEDGRLYVRGVNRGVTTVYVTAKADNGESITHSMIVYVDTDVPQLESVTIMDNPMVVRINEDRPVQWYSTPSETHCNLTFTTEDKDIIEISPDGWVHPLKTSRATVNVSVEQNPNLNTSFDVIVIDTPVVSGFDNGTICVATPTRLVLDGGDLWSQDELNVRYESRWGENYYTVTEDGVVTALEPGNYDLYVCIEQCDRTYEYQVFFEAVRPENYFYTDKSEYLLIEGMSAGFSYHEFQDPQDITFEDSNPGVIELIDDDNFYAAAPGTTTLTLTAHYEDGSTVECLNPITITVLEAQSVEPTVKVDVPRVVHVGETVDVYFQWEPAIDYVSFGCTSEDSSILEVSDDGWHITGVKPGVVTLKCGAYFGDIIQNVYTTTTIYVVE